MMRLMTNIFTKMLSLGVLAAVCCGGLNISMAHAGCSGVIYVGDSRTVGMAHAAGLQGQKSGYIETIVAADSNGNYWIAKVGAALSWFNQNKGKIEGLLADNYNTVVIALGGNDMPAVDDAQAQTKAQNKAKEYANAINSFSQKWTAQGKKVSFSLTIRHDEQRMTASKSQTGMRVISNAATETFNNALKQKLLNVSFIDARSTITDSDFEADGAHFTPDASKKLYNSISSQACSGASSTPAENVAGDSNNATNPNLDKMEDCSLFDKPECKPGGKGYVQKTGSNQEIEKCNNLLPKDVTSLNLATCKKNCASKYPISGVLKPENDPNVAKKESCEKSCLDANQNRGLIDKYNNCTIKAGTTVSTVKCPAKTSSKEECEKRNNAIKSGGQYCKAASGSSQQNNKNQCMITKTSTGDTKGRCACSNCKYPGGTITPDITQAIADASQKYNIPAVVLAAYIQVESAGSWNPNVQACLGDGGGGLVQFQPTTWAQYATTGCHTVREPNHYKQDSNGEWKVSKPAHDVKVCGQGKCKGKGGRELTQEDRFDAYSNIMCAAVLLTDNMKSTGSLECGILAHNRGPGGANTYKKTYGNCTSASYYKSINDAMQKLAKQNNCSLDALGLGGGCEYFDITSTTGGQGTVGGGTASQQAIQQVTNVQKYESAYKCNVRENYSSIKGCIFCGLFRIIYNTASEMARYCHEKFANSLVTLLAIGLAISLAFMVLQFVSDMTQKDPGTLLNKILRQCFAVILVIALLKMNVTEFFNLFITPVFTTGFKLAELAIASSNVSFVTPDPSPWEAITATGLPVEMGVSMLKAIYAVQSRLEQLLALGSNAICVALYVESFWGLPIFPHFGYLITGLFLWLISAVFMVIYPFLLIDSVLQFTIASALFPVALASQAFKITRDRLNIFKVINIFISSMFVFIFLTIVLFILLAGIDKSVADTIKKTYESSSGYFSLQALGWYSETFLKLVFFLFLGKAVLEDIPTFAEDFAKAITMGQGGRTDLGIGRQVGGMAAGAVTNAGLMAKDKGKDIAKSSFSLARKGLQSTTSSIRSMRHNYLMKHTQDKLSKAAAAGLATGGIITGRTWWGQKVTRQIVTNPDGTKMLQSTRKSLFRRKNVVTMEDQNMSIKRKYNKDGTCQEAFKMRSSLTRNLFNADGTTNKETLNKIMQTSGLPKEQIQKALAVEMMKKRMPNLGKKAFLGGKFKSEQMNSYKDDQGHDIFEIRRIDKKGKVSILKMTQGDKRSRLDYEEISGGKSTKYSSDGLIQKKESNSYDVNRDGTLNTSTSAVINGAQVDNLKTTADGMLRDNEGNVMGRVLANGNLADAQGNIIGTAQAKDLAFGADGRCLGKMTLQGTVIDKDGNTSGYLGNNGTVLDEQGHAIGGMTSPGAFNDMLNSSKKSSKSEFSNARNYRGARLFDDDGVREDNFADEEILYDDSELALYKRQMKKYGDILKHRAFGI